mmetsp:Transcript_42936/g.167852  ORF Transcript_42936/g.167852 Transcript_42936/m.167852 type:complete len:217 (+) Transcript_42936:125-775(+)
MQSGEKGGDGSFESQYPELDASLLKLQGCAMDNLKRLDDLRRAIANLREGIGPSKELVWPQLLAKFQVVSKTYLALSQTLIQAMTSANLGDFALVPKAAPSDPEAVSELLRTKIDIPESTEEEGIRDLESMDKVCNFRSPRFNPSFLAQSVLTPEFLPEPKVLKSSFSSLKTQLKTLISCVCSPWFLMKILHRKRSRKGFKDITHTSKQCKGTWKR